jgi:hypothetical protein
MCEPFILHKTGLTIEDHQKITVDRYARLLDLTNVYVMPVLQGLGARGVATPAPRVPVPPPESLVRESFRHKHC